MGVINGKDGRKHIGVVAIFANVAGLNVGGGLARCVYAVMAIKTVARNVDVIEIRWQPADCGMAVVTVVATVDVRRCFTSRDYAIVA